MDSLMNERSTLSGKKAQHLGSSRQYWRDAILGVNDGLVSTFLLVTGVAAGGLSSKDILLTAVAGALAGAISMCAGEYVATKSQNEVMQGEILLEETHINTHMTEEISELADLLSVIGIPREEKELQQTLQSYYRQHPKELLKIMVALEFGVVQDEVRSPIAAGLTSCFLFIVGSLPSVIPFIFLDHDPMRGLIGAMILTTLALLCVGGLKTWATRGNCFHSSTENLLIAGCGGVFAYGVGAFFDSILK